MKYGMLRPFESNRKKPEVVFKTSGRGQQKSRRVYFLPALLQRIFIFSFANPSTKKNGFSNLSLLYFEIQPL